MAALEPPAPMVELARPLGGARVSTLANVPLVGMEPPALFPATPARPAPAPVIPRVPIPAMGLTLARAIQDILAVDRSAPVNS